jgi:hypothetical protein
MKRKATVFLGFAVLLVLGMAFMACDNGNGDGADAYIALSSDTRNPPQRITTARVGNSLGVYISKNVENYIEARFFLNETLVFTQDEYNNYAFYTPNTAGNLYAVVDDIYGGSLKTKTITITE